MQELQSSPTLSIDRIKVYPHTSDNRLDISFDIQNHSNKTLKGEVSYTLKEIGSTKKKGTYKKIKTINKNKTVSFVTKLPKKKGTCYFKVRTYRKAEGKVYYGKDSAVKSKKVKYRK